MGCADPMSAVRHEQVVSGRAERERTTLATVPARDASHVRMSCPHRCAIW